MRRIFTLILLILPFFPFSSGFSQIFIEEYEDGSTFHEGPYENGFRVGLHTYFHPNGKEWAIIEFDEKGMPLKCKTWDEAGNLMEEIDYEGFTLGELPDVDMNNSLDEIRYYLDDTPKVQWPAGTKKAEVHYALYLPSGFRVESSFESGKTFRFKLNNQAVIPGFEKAVSLLSPGQTGWFQIPPELGYGPYPVGNIPPFTPLIYQIRLISLK